jgi:hypothetical protein
METESIKTYYERYSATAWLPNSKIKADEDTRELYYKILKASITKENKEDLICL